MSEIEAYETIGRAMVKLWNSNRNANLTHRLNDVVVQGQVEPRDPQFFANVLVSMSDEIDANGGVLPE